MQKMLFLSYLLIVSYLTALAADDTKTVGSSIKSATVYRNGAELVHIARAALPQGSSELIIDGISNTIDINSLQINCPSTVTILGVEFSNQYLVNEMTTPAMKRLRDSVEIVNDEIEKISISISTTEELIVVLKSNKEIKGSQTGLSVAELIRLMDYYKIKSSELQNELSSLKSKKEKYRLVLVKLTSQIQEEQKKNTRSAGRIILQLSVALPGENEFSISYLTPNAFWTPYYDMKIESVKSPIRIIYKAKISQSTGIDWKKVKLSLSTSAPSQYGAAPLLKSWFLSYINPVRQMERDLSKQNTIPSALEEKATGLSEIVVSAYGAAKIRGKLSPDAMVSPIYIVNGAEMTGSDYARLNPNSIKEITVLKNEEATGIYGARGTNGAIIVTLKEGLEDYVSVTDNELDVSYDIDLPYDVPTNGKQQIATLKEVSVTGNFKFYAVPKLDKEVYLLTGIADWEKLNLLAGEANILFEGTYVGKSFIDPASTNDTLNLTLGKDKRVVVKREKMMDFSSVKFMGSNKLQTITYELTVKNNKKDAINFILKDQYPISTNKEIGVELLESSGAEINEEIAVLTWKLQLAPGESKKVRISYSVRYPKGRLVNLN
jgi:TonB-dependent SusC/RagA subfamily outer membrane receptor